MVCFLALSFSFFGGSGAGRGLFWLMPGPFPEPQENLPVLLYSRVSNHAQQARQMHPGVESQRRPAGGCGWGAEAPVTGL